jgi:hypothetical protein
LPASGHPRDVNLIFRRGRPATHAGSFLVAPDYHLKGLEIASQVKDKRFTNIMRLSIEASDIFGCCLALLPCCVRLTGHPCPPVIPPSDNDAKHLYVDSIKRRGSRDNSS